MPTLLIRGGVIVSDKLSFRSDLLIKDEKIVQVDKKIVSAADEIIDASNCHVFPGGVDPHVHLKLRTQSGISSDDFVSGTRAALAGGTTTIMDFVTPHRDESLLGALADRKAVASKALCDYGLHMGVTSWDKKRCRELEACRREEGITSLKAYLAYKESIGLNDHEFLDLLDAARRFRILPLVHAESGDMVAYLQRKLLAEGKTAANYHPLSRPPEVEGDAINRALLMARLVHVALYIVHVSTRQGIEAVATARKSGQVAIAETCPQYVILDDTRYNGKTAEAALYVMSPPLRSREHQDALWQGLASGLVQTIGSDHCPFNLAEKRKYAFSDFTRIPNGCGGIEYRLPLLYTFGVRAGKISMPRFVDLVSTRPAKIFGLYPRKGTIFPGSDADIVVWDPTIENSISAARQWQRCDHTVYQDLKLNGGPRFVLSRGEVVYAEGKVIAKPGRGLYLARE